MPEPLTLTAAGIAALLGCKVETVYRRVGDWRRDHGFPAPLPGSRLYSAAAVSAWIDRGGLPAPPPPATPALADDMAACEARLVDRARLMVAAE